MTTMGNDGPQQVNLNEMLAQGGREAAVAFHLLSIEFHASIIETSGDAEDLEMLGDMLVQHMMGVRACQGRRDNGPLGRRDRVPLT